MAMTFRILQLAAVLACVTLVRGRGIWNHDNSIVLLGADPSGGAILPVNTANLFMVNDRNRGRSVTQINDREDDWSEDAIDQLSDAELSDWGYDDSSDLTEGNKNDIGQIGLNSGNIGELNFDERRWLEDLMAQTGSRDRKNQIILAENDGDESQSDEDENDIGQIGINNGLIQEWNYGRRRF